MKSTALSALALTACEAMTASASPRRSAGISSDQAPHLDVAGGGQLQADGAGDVDVEAGEDIVLVEVVEGRIVAVGEEADGDAPRQRLALALLGRTLAPAGCCLLRRSREGSAAHSARPTKSKATAPRLVCNMLIRVRPFRVQAPWPWGTRGGGRPAIAFARADSRPHTSADAARRTAGRRPSPAIALRAPEYAFLVGALIDPATLERAEAEARRCGVATHEVLLAAGWISQDDYAAALARWLGVPLVAWDAELDLADVGPAPGDGERACRRGSTAGLAACWPPPAAAPDALCSQTVSLRSARRACGPGAAARIDAALEAHGRQQRIDQAVRGLLRERPASSARPRVDLAAGGGGRPGRPRHRRLCSCCPTPRWPR